MKKIISTFFIVLIFLFFIRYEAIGKEPAKTNTGKKSSESPEKQKDPGQKFDSGALRLNERSKQAEGVVWAYIKDQAAGKGIQAGQIHRWVKDSKGHLFKFIPKGPKLKFGISTDVINAQGKKFGWKMIPVSTKGAKELGKNLSSKWEFFKFGHDLYNIYSDETITDEEAQNQVIAATIAMEIGLAGGKAGSSRRRGSGGGPCCRLGNG